jgi:hypothetical protein
MGSENAKSLVVHSPEFASENRAEDAPPRRGRAAVDLTEPFTAVLEQYTAALRSSPLSDQTRRTYASKVRQYLAWLADADTEARRSDLATRATGQSATTAATCKPSSSASPRLSTTRSRRSTTSTSAAASDRRAPPAPSSRGPHRRRLTRAPRCGFCAKSRSAPRRAIARSRSSRSTPAPGSPRSPAWTSTTSGCPRARASCGSSAKASASHAPPRSTRRPQRLDRRTLRLAR